MEAGIDDVGIGVLFGLFDWRFELLALMQHIRHLEAAFGVGPHTISVPRLEPATGSQMASHPPQRRVRRGLPEDRGHPSPRRPLHGHHHVHARDGQDAPGDLRPGRLARSPRAAARTRAATPTDQHDDEAQFSLGDHRPLDEVIRDVAELGYIPSFCTACYRLGRTGADFMDLAKPGDIKAHCDPNALSTFQEYLAGLRRPRSAGRGRGGHRAPARRHGPEHRGRVPGR